MNYTSRQLNRAALAHLSMCQGNAVIADDAEKSKLKKFPAQRKSPKNNFFGAQ
jgi:hypothetical protein